MLMAPTSMFNNSADIERLVQTRDAGGAIIWTYGAHLSSVPCRCQPASGRTQQSINSRYANEVSHVVYIASGLDITDKDRVIIGTRTLDILGITDFDLEGVYTRLDCEEKK